MGFLSFLTKRSGDKTKPKSRSNNAAPAVFQPTQASKPATNYSTPVVEETSRGRSRVSKKPYLINPPVVKTVDEDPAPSPTVPWFRDESIERPSTAPNGSQSSTLWAGAGARLRRNPPHKAPPVSFRMVRPSTANSSARAVPPGGLRSFDVGASQPTRIHSRSNSISNSISTRGDGSRAYKDLLDAQSEIRPFDFKSRVRASGVRDYGEDVADRNLGENGFNLESNHVQAFYAQFAGCSQHHHNPHDSMAAANARNRTRSLSSASNFHFPQNTAAQLSSVPQIRPPEGFALGNSASPLLRRRQSENAYSAGSVFGHESDPSSQRSTSHRTTGSPTRRVVLPEDEKLSWDLPSLPSLKISSPVTSERPRTARPASVQSPHGVCDFVRSARQRAGTPYPDHIVDGIFTSHPLPTERSVLLQTSPLSNCGSVTNPTTSPRKRHSLHTIQQHTSLSTHDSTFDSTPLSYPRHKSLQNVKQRVNEQPLVNSPPDSLSIDFDVASSPTKPVELARSYYLKSPFTIHKIREVAEMETGFGPTPRHNNPEDSPGQATLKTRSLRASSTSSTTPTTSDASSNPSQRPQSRHTANTSVDLSICASSLTKIPSHASMDSGAVMSPKAAKSSTFNIDDYISSDDDSYMEPRRPRGEGEEGLLFSESGYGRHGFQLPGLADAVPLSSRPKDKQLLQHARSSISLPPVYDCDSFGRAGARRFILDTAADSDEEEYQVHPANDISPTRGVRGTRRLSAICGSPLKQPQAGYTHDVIVEERTGKVDVSTAVKLRKEAKAQKRASGVPLGRPRRTRSAIPLGFADRVPTTADDEANNADIE